MLSMRMGLSFLTAISRKFERRFVKLRFGQFCLCEGWEKFVEIENHELLSIGMVYGRLCKIMSSLVRVDNKVKVGLEILREERMDENGKTQ